uniref:FHA domain-containing protein n=1 Tax=Magallana gigas TaxID=29159 RepID=A0A8W8KI25_MAGGI
MYHLKRIGPAPNRPRVVNVMDFFKVTNLIGRNALQVDFYIDSNERMQSHMISRCHARVVRQQNNDHKLFDDSLNGIFVNHIKIRGCVILCEGDRVTFGHPMGRDIPFGTWERQVNNHHQFIFEKCCCEPKSTVKKSPKRGKFVIPKKTSPKNLAAKRERNQTRTFTQADIQDLKEKSKALFPTCSKGDSSSTAGISNSETSETTAPGDVEVSDNLRTTINNELLDIPRITTREEIWDISRPTTDDVIPDNFRTATHENMNSTSAADTFLNVLNDSSVTDVQVQQNEILGDERESLADNQSNPLCDSTDIDVSELTSENNSGLLEQGVDVDEQVVTDQEKLAGNSDRSPLCPTHSMRNDAVSDDDYQKEFEFKRPEVVDSPNNITTASLVEEEESDLEGSRFILSDSIDYTFSEQEMEEDDISFESDSDSVDPRESNSTETYSTLTVKEKTSTECDNKNVSSESDSDNDMIDLGESDTGEGRGGEVMTSITGEGNEVQTSEILCSGELLICPNAAHTNHPDQGENSQTAQVSEDGKSLYINKAEESHVLIGQSKPKEEVVSRISPKKVIRSSFRLTDSVEYTMEESLAELESRNEVNQEDTMQKMEETDVKDEEDDLGVDLKLMENVKMIEDKGIVENVNEEDEQIGEDLDVCDVLGEDLDLKKCDQREELNATGPMPRFEDTMKDPDHQNILIGEAAHTNSQTRASDVDKEGRPRHEQSFNSNDQVTEQYQSDLKKEKTKVVPPECVPRDKETDTFVKINAKDSENNRTDEDYSYGNQQGGCPYAYENQISGTQENKKSVIISDTLENPVSESKTIESKEPVTKTDDLETVVSLSKHEALENMDSISNTKVQKIQNSSINCVALGNDLAMKNREPILDSEEKELLQKCDALEDEEQASGSVASEDNVVLNVTKTTSDCEALIDNVTTKPASESVRNREAMEGEALKDEESISDSWKIEPMLKCDAVEDREQASGSNAFEDNGVLKTTKPNSEALIDNMTMTPTSDSVELVNQVPVQSKEAVERKAFEDKKPTFGCETVGDEEPISNREALEDKEPTSGTMKIEVPISNIDTIENTELPLESVTLKDEVTLKIQEPILDSGALEAEESISINTLLKEEKPTSNETSNDEVIEDEKQTTYTKAMEITEPTSDIEAFEENEQICNEALEVKSRNEDSEDEKSRNNKVSYEAEPISNDKGLEKEESESNSEEVQEWNPASNVEEFERKNPVSASDAVENETLVNEKLSSKSELLEDNVSLPKSDALEGEMTLEDGEQISGITEFVEKDSFSNTEAQEQAIDKVNSGGHVIENGNVRSEMGVLKKNESELDLRTEALEFKPINEQQALTDSNQNSYDDKFESEPILNSEVNKDSEMSPADQNDEVADLTNKKSDQKCTLEESDTVLTFSSSSSFTPSDLICTFDVDGNDVQTSLNAGSCDTSTADNVSSAADAIQTNSEEKPPEELKINNMNDFNGGNASEQDKSRFEQTSIELIKTGSDTKTQEKDTLQDSAPVLDCQLIDQHEGPNHMESSTTSSNSNEMEDCHAVEIKIQSTTLPLEYLNGKKRKIEEMTSAEDCDPPKKKKLSEKELEPVKKIVSNFFKIREYCEKQKDVNKNDLRKHLLGNLVRHFFKTHPIKNVEEEIKCNAKSMVTNLDLQETSHKSSTVVCDRDSNNKGQSTLSDTEIPTDTVDGSKFSYEASEKGESQEDIMEVLSLSQESSSALSSSQPDSIPIYQASVKPGCGIVVNMGQWKKPEKRALEETSKDTAVCDVETQANSLDIDVETSVLWSQDHLMDDRPLEERCEDSDQTCLDEESVNLEELDKESINSKVRERSSSNESDTSQRSELLLEKVIFPVVDMDDEESSSTIQERKSFSGEENQEGEDKQPVEDVMNQESGNIGSPHSLHSTASIDYTEEYLGIVDSSNDIQHSCTDKQSDSDSTLLQSGQDSAVEDTEDQIQKDLSEDMTESNINMSANPGESSENVGSQSSELDSEGVEILSTKSTSESELEVLYGPTFITPCRAKGSLKAEHVIKSESPRKRESSILKEEKEGAKSENCPSDSKTNLDQSSLSETEKSEPETAVGCSPEEDKDLTDDASTTLVNTPSDTINGRSNTKKYFKSRLPKFESDSDIEIVETKPSLTLKSADDFHISLSDSSSDDLPEVLFLKEEKATAPQSVLCTKALDIKEEPVTPSKTPDLSKAVSRLDLTPSKQGDNSSPRKVCRKRLSLRRTPVKKQKESKPSPLARRTRTPRKSPDKKQKSKSMFIDSDIEIVSGSESEEDFTPSRLKRIKQEAETDSYSDSEGRKDGRGDKIKEDLDEDRGNIPKQKEKHVEDDSNNRKQQQRKEPGDSTHLPDNQGGNRENTLELEDKEEVSKPCEEEGGIKRIYPLLEQSSVESSGAGSLADIFQMEDSEHTQPGERENQEEREGQDVFPGGENSKPAEDSTDEGEQLLYKVNTMSNKMKDSEKSEGDWKDSGQGKIDSKEKGDVDVGPETTSDESEPLEDDQCADDCVANTCPENSEDEHNYGLPPVLSPYCSQSLSPLVPDITSENSEPKTNLDIASKTDSLNKSLQTPTKPILQMEFDSDSEFSAPEVNLDALDSPDVNVSGADGHVEIGNLNEDSNEVFDGESLGNEKNQNVEKTKEDEGKEDFEMEEDLPDISRKRKSQNDSVDFESKRQKKKKSTGKDNSSQIKDLQTETRSSDQHSSQNASGAKESRSISRVRQLMQKLRAKKSTSFVTDQSPDQLSSSGMASSRETPGDTPRTSHVQRRLLPSLNTPYQRTLDYLQRCKEILQTLKTDFSQSESLASNPRITQWKKEMRELENRMSLSKTVIAVVGDTGSGKSSLMNALLDQLDILPTSGMRACTAVVVEVVTNSTNNKYEADITFLSREEWYTELKLLLRDLTDVHGNIKKGTPDPKSEAGVAFLKIKAVYGKVDRFEALCRQTTVTRWLDEVKTISHSEPTHFRNAIDKYIETADPGVGNQYWPIVKKVTVRLPNCDACSSGAVLVDLPGVRDSNAARDKIARDHLKNCTAVWVVSSIHRAIDDKTAKDLLGENFRRQLLMDGQYGNIAFICTKTDVIKNSEIIRGLHLEEKVKPIEDEINRLEMEKNDLEISKRSNKMCIKQMEKESAELRQNIEEMEECLLTDGGCGESEEIKEMKALLKEKQESLQKNNENLQTYRQAVDENERKSLQHGMTITQRRKELSSLCAKARNDYSRKEIKRDFKAGLREMKRKAGNVSNIEELEDDDLYNSDEDDEDIGNSAENLKVFCVSATEYQKMRNIILDDGPPTVFGTEQETQIPALRSYIHQMTEVRHRSSMERILQTVAQFVFDIQNYLTEAETVQTKGERLKSRSAIEERTFTLKQKFESVIAQLQADIEGAISNQIKPKLGEGITAATARANEQTAKWSAPVDKENKQAGGLHWCTYRATVRRQGVYSSPTYGQVNFNEDLTAPMYNSISIVWDKVFSGILWGYFERFKVTVLMVLRQFVANLCQELQTHGVQSSSTQRVQLYLLDTANQKLTETVAQLKEYVTERQRDASRVLTPVIQENLTRVYDYCAVQSGGGTYARIKQAMAEGVDKGRLYMFDDASRRLLQELEQIQTDVVAKVRDTCSSICTTLKTAFEPLWEAPGTFLHLRDNLLPSITEISLKLQNIMEEAGVRAPVTAMPTAPPAARSDSDQPAAQSSQFQRLQDIQGNDSSELPQHPSPDSDVLTSIKSELGGTRQPLAASAIKREPQASSSNSPPVRFPYVKSEPTSNIKVCCFCGYPGTNPVQCERCLVTRQTSKGMVYMKCIFCRQIGTSTQVCEKCRRCLLCGNYVLPPNSVCQRCKTNAPSTSIDGSNTIPLSAVLNSVASVTLKRIADAMHLPNHPAKACRSSETVQKKESPRVVQKRSCYKVQQIGDSVIGQQRGSVPTIQQVESIPPLRRQHNVQQRNLGQQPQSQIIYDRQSDTAIGQQRGRPQTPKQNKVLLIGQQGGSTKTVHQNSSSLKGQQRRSDPTIQQMGSTPPLERQSNNIDQQPQSQIIYDRRSSTPNSQACNLSSRGRDRMGSLQPPSRVPKNLGYKDMCKEN